MKRRVTITFPTIQSNHNPYKYGLVGGGGGSTSYYTHSTFHQQKEHQQSPSCDFNGNNVTSFSRCCGYNGTAAGSNSNGASPNDDWRIYAFIAIVAVGIYINGIHGEFVHDDIPAITMNKDVLGVTPITHVFRNDFWGTPMSDINSHKSYRPLTTLSFR